jgi:hypothetical protein
MNTALFLSILNKTIFTILNIVLLGLLLITPADAIRQALDNHQLYNVFVIAGTYFVTGFLAIMIYAGRLWTSNTVLKAIPKTYIPVETGDVGENVRKMIEGSLKRSAVIAWEFTPRAETQVAAEDAQAGAEAGSEAGESMVQPPEPEERKRWLEIFPKKLSKQEKDEQAMVMPPYKSTWDSIAHDGWSSPLSPDLPNVQYTSVIQELPHLVEARAVSVAPPDPTSTSDPPMPDLRAVELLTRPLSMGLRDYIEHLLNLEIVTSPPTASAFLDAYEHARFSAQPLSEPQFRDLMKLFAELLRSIQALSPTLLAPPEHDSDASDIDDDGASAASTPTSASMLSFHSASTRSARTVRTARSRTAGTASRASTAQRPQDHTLTAPATSAKKRPMIARPASANSFAQSKRVYEAGGGSSSSPSSESLGSSDQGSVIRLNPSRDEGELPYTLTIKSSH